MAAILGKKVGMTQRSCEDGRVERVTVLEAGPCPVSGHSGRSSATATRPSSWPSARVRKRCSPRRKLGHLKKARCSPRTRVVREFRNEVGELLDGPGRDG